MTQPIIPDPPEYGTVDYFTQFIRARVEQTGDFYVYVSGTFVGTARNLRDGYATVQTMTNLLVAVELLEAERQVARRVDDGSELSPAPVICSPKCNDLNVAGPTGAARSWHSDDCPVPVMHHATNGVTACRVPVADLPRSAGYAPDRDGYITCKSCNEELKHSQECREQLEERPCRFDCPARDAARKS
jgi:hypothetical protein